MPRKKKEQEDVTTEAVPAIKPGRPLGSDSYEPWMCDKIVELASQGMNLSRMIVELGFKSEQTFYNLQKRHPDFKEACEYAHLCNRAYWKTVHEEVARGERKGDPKSLHMILYNKVRGAVHDQDEYIFGNQAPATINVAGNIQVTQIAQQVLSLDKDAVANRIDELKRKLLTSQTEVIDAEVIEG